MIKKLIALAVIFTLLFSLTACGGEISGKQLQKLIEDCRICPLADIGSVKIISEADIADGAKAVLFSGKIKNTGETFFSVSVVNEKRNKIENLEFSYPPMQYLHKEITENRNEALNLTYFDKVTEKLAEDYKYFSSDDNGKEFLRAITGKGGITSAATAREAIDGIAKYGLGLEKAENFCGIYEEDNANPYCFAASVSEPVYAWDWLPEEKYLSFVSDNSREELEKAETEYGAPYRDETVWVSYDFSGAVIGTYATKAELYTAVTGLEKDFGESDAPADGVLKLIVAGDKFPFVYELNNQLLGADIEVASSIADMLNMELEISAVSSQEAAVNNAADGIFHMAMGALTPDFAKDGVTFTDSYIDDYVIVLCSKNLRINSKICTALAELKDNGKLDEISDNAAKKRAEKKAEEDKKEEKKETNENSGNNETENRQTSDSAVISYRVRKNGDDPSTQLSAFASLENAIKDVNDHPGEGYKVFDMSGNLVYAP